MGSERVPVSTQNWQADANAIFCKSGDHLLAFYEAGFRGDMRRMTGHAFFQCRNCRPFSQFLAVFSKIDGLAEVRCYALNEESYKEWDSNQDATPPTPELLCKLRDPEGKSHNPYYLPPKPRRDAR
jgi:hypothetical protein